MQSDNDLIHLVGNSIYGFNQYLQTEYSEYFSGAQFVKSWGGALVWVIVGSMGACVCLWHTGKPIPWIGSKTVKRMQCSPIVQFYAIAMCTAFSIPFSVLLEAVTARQIAYSAASVVFVFSRASGFLAGLRG